MKEEDHWYIRHLSGPVSFFLLTRLQFLPPNLPLQSQSHPIFSAPQIPNPPAHMLPCSWPHHPQRIQTWVSSLWVSAHSPWGQSVPCSTWNIACRIFHSSAIPPSPPHGLNFLMQEHHHFSSFHIGITAVFQQQPTSLGPQECFPRPAFQPGTSGLKFQMLEPPED